LLSSFGVFFLFPPIASPILPCCPFVPPIDDPGPPQPSTAAFCDSPAPCPLEIRFSFAAVMKASLWSRLPPFFLFAWHDPVGTQALWYHFFTSALALSTFSFHTVQVFSLLFLDLSLSCSLHGSSPATLLRPLGFFPLHRLFRTFDAIPLTSSPSPFLHHFYQAEPFKPAVLSHNCQSPPRPQNLLLPLGAFSAFEPSSCPQLRTLRLAFQFFVSSFPLPIDARVLHAVFSRDHPTFPSLPLGSVLPTVNRCSFCRLWALLPPSSPGPGSPLAPLLF